MTNTPLSSGPLGPHTPLSPRRPKTFSRRGVLGMLGAGTVGVAGYGMWSFTGRHSSFPVDAAATDARDRPVRDNKAVVAGDKANRALVMIELEGGHDWVSTLVPYSDPALRGLRDSTLPDMDALIHLDDRYAITLDSSLQGTHYARPRSVELRLVVGK